MYASLQGVDGPAIRPPEQQRNNFLEKQHRLGNTSQVTLELPVIYVLKEACLRFSVYMEGSFDSRILVNSSTGLQQWIQGDDTQSWKNVSFTILAESCLFC